MCALLLSALVNLCSITNYNMGQAGSTGLINSPGYPDAVPLGHRSQCQMHVTSLPDCHIQLEFRLLQLPQCSGSVTTAGVCIPG